MVAKSLLPNAWVLWDPITPHFDSGGDLFRRSDGNAVDDIGNARGFQFRGRGPAETRFAPGCCAWEPKHVSYFPIRKKPVSGS